MPSPLIEGAVHPWRISNPSTVALGGAPQSRAQELFRFEFTSEGPKTLTVTESNSGLRFIDPNGVQETSYNRTVSLNSHLIVKSVNPDGITVIDWNTKTLRGRLPQSAFNKLKKLTQFYCSSNQLTGSIPSLSANTALSVFYCRSNQLTGWEGGTISSTLGDFQAQNNLLPVETINALLAAFVAAGRNSGTRGLNLGGTGNAAPTGQGLTDKATLISRGWTVTTN